MNRENQIAFRVSDETVTEIEELLETAKQSGALPPSATRSDIVRIALLYLLAEWDDSAERIEDQTRKYYLEA